MNTRRVETVINGKKGYLMARKGRKLKSGKRHECGKLEQPKPEERAKDVRSVAMNNPDRRAYGEMARSQLAGYPLGRMVLNDKITKQQAATIERAGNIIWCHLRTIPDAKLNGDVPSWARYTKDDLGTEYAPQDAIDREPETEEDREERVRDAFDRLQQDLCDGGYLGRRGLIVTTHLRLCDIHEHDIGDLRMMANHLARVWKARREV
jgi:hypothetical protein